MSPEEMLEHARRVAGGGKAMNKEQQQAFMQSLLPALEPGETPPAEQSQADQPQPTLGLDGPSPAVVQLTAGGSISVEHVPSIMSREEALRLAGALVRVATSSAEPHDVE